MSSIIGHRQAKNRMNELATAVHFAETRQEKRKVPHLVTLLGPAGNGKTTLAEAVADALGMPAHRIDHDSLQARQRLSARNPTHVGGKPAFFADAILKSGTERVLFMIEEIDKAPLEALNDLASLLDQRAAQHTDSWLGIPLNLTNCVFVVTANDLDALPKQLRSRLATSVVITEALSRDELRLLIDACVQKDPDFAMSERIKDLLLNTVYDVHERERRASDPLAPSGRQVENALLHLKDVVRFTTQMEPNNGAEVVMHSHIAQAFGVACLSPRRIGNVLELDAHIGEFNKLVQASDGISLQVKDGDNIWRINFSHEISVQLLAGRALANVSIEAINSRTGIASWYETTKCHRFDAQKSGSDELMASYGPLNDALDSYNYLYCRIKIKHEK